MCEVFEVFVGKNEFDKDGNVVSVVEKNFYRVSGSEKEVKANAFMAACREVPELNHKELVVIVRPFV